jgi:hypothetical protein
MSRARAQRPFFSADAEVDAVPARAASATTHALFKVEPVGEPGADASLHESALQEERVARGAALRAERARWRLGDTRPADNPCRACSQERIERLEDIAASGCQTWAVMCVNAACSRSRASRNASEKAGTGC